MILSDIVSQWGFSGSSDGEESTCNAGDPGLIPGLGRSAGEGNSYSLQYSGLENSVVRGVWRATTHKELDTTERLSLSLFHQLVQGRARIQTQAMSSGPRPS